MGRLLQEVVRPAQHHLAGVRRTGINAARAELVERGVEVTEVKKFPWGQFLFFKDPDGNGWAVQSLPARDR